LDELYHHDCWNVLYVLGYYNAKHFIVYMIKSIVKKIIW
jgi:hypothetical protein